MADFYRKRQICTESELSRSHSTYIITHPRDERSGMSFEFPTDGSPESRMTTVVGLTVRVLAGRAFCRAADDGCRRCVPGDRRSTSVRRGNRVWTGFRSREHGSPGHWSSGLFLYGPSTRRRFAVFGCVCVRTRAMSFVLPGTRPTDRPTDSMTGFRRALPDGGAHPSPPTRPTLPRRRHAVFRGTRTIFLHSRLECPFWQHGSVLARP